MYSKKIISTFLAVVLISFSCTKEKQAVVNPTLESDKTVTIAQNLISSKYSFYESNLNEANFDALFETTELADKFENSLELDKANLNQLGIKYTSHATTLKVLSRETNSDVTETLRIEETTTLKTNQISALTNEVITSIIQQQYNLTIKSVDGAYKIVSFEDVDKTILENKKKTSEIESLTKEEEAEITNLSQKLNSVATTYNRTNVLSYAATYAVVPNPAYQDFSPGLCSYCGGDCTNFLSQCFLAGGWPQIFGSSSSLSTWWYGKSTNPAGYRTGFSGVWVSAMKTGFFLKKLTTRVTRVTTLSSLQLADGVQLVGSTGNAYHSLVVTQISTTGNVFLSCHTSNRYNAPISTWGLTSTSGFSGILPKAFLWKVKNSF